MNYHDAELQGRLAARYVSGALRGGARRRFEQLMTANASLRRTVHEWEDQLYPIVHALPPIAPPKRVWRRIRERLHPHGASRWGWHGVYLWRALSGALALAIIAGVALYPMQVEEAARHRMVAVLQNTTGAMLVIRADGNDAVHIRTLQNLGSVAGDRALELWAIAPGGSPQSLGLVAADGTTVLERPAGLTASHLLAITLEPQGGSPTGQPSSAPIMSGTLLEI